MKRAIGFDIGGSTLRAGVVAFDGADWSIETERRELLTPEAKEPEALVAAIAEVIQELASTSPVDGVGIGLPGQMTDGGRSVVNAPNLGWRDVDVADQLDRAWPQAMSRLDVRFDNDLNVILLGEQQFGAARGCEHVVAIYPGTGIGGAVMVEGQLVRGARGFAGEVGHVFWGGDILCGCGKTGCIETIAGGAYIEQRVNAMRGKGLLDPERWPEGPALRVDDVDRAYRAGDPSARSLWDEVATELTRLAATAVALLNPEMVVLGGGVVEHCPALRERLTRDIASAAPEVSGRGLRIEVGRLGSQAGILGAAALSVE